MCLSVLAGKYPNSSENKIIRIMGIGHNMIQIRQEVVFIDNCSMETQSVQNYMNNSDIMK